LFFTDKGRVYWQKVYNLPALSRESKGRAVVNLLNLGEGETITDCRAVRDFDQPDHYLMMATKKGLVKKTDLAAYSRPMKTGIIAIKLKEDDELVDVAITKAGDEVILATATGMAIRFSEADARPMGRNTSGVKGIKLSAGDSLVGMVVADPDATLLTACANGYGKRTPFGPNASPTDTEGDAASEFPASSLQPPASEDEAEGESSSSFRYRTQNRGGKGLRDIKTTERNGPVISIVRVDDADELLMMTARGKIQRIKASDVSVIGRNTQGVRIMTLDEGDTLTAVVRVPKDENGGDETGETAGGDETESPAPDA
jgi:DNA gyrase subunit A